MFHLKTPVNRTQLATRVERSNRSACFSVTSGHSVLLSLLTKPSITPLCVCVCVSLLLLSASCCLLHVIASHPKVETIIFIFDQMEWRG